MQATRAGTRLRNSCACISRCNEEEEEEEAEAEEEEEFFHNYRF
jgi:hypothetical protein